METSIGTEGNTVVGGKKVVKTPFKALMRHLVWRRKRWYSDDMKEWLNDFKPEVLLLMNSDAIFILDIATFISRTRNIPLVMFNTEGYYFFHNSYFNRSSLFSNSLFALYQSIYRRHFRTMMRQVVLTIHLNSLLKEDYQKEFGGDNRVLYTGSNVSFDCTNLHVKKPTFSYLGNFGFDRPSALIEIAGVLQSISPNYILDVYGKIPNTEIEKRFDECKGINYKGMVPYDEVVNLLYSSTIIFHAEVQNESMMEFLRYGFSTKIADSISCGHPFIMYSSPEIAGAKYIIESGAGWFASNKHELKSKIIDILTDETQRQVILERAKDVAIENHRIETNTKKFQDMLLQCCKACVSGTISVH